MKTSLIIISTLLALSVFVPFIMFIYKSLKNTGSIKKQSQSLLKSSGITYGDTEVWRKNFIGLSKDKKTLTYINFKKDIPHVNNISLSDIKQCNIIKSYNNAASTTPTLKNLDLELVSKSASKPHVIIAFFNLDEDLIQDFDLQRIEKWQQLIKSSLIEQMAAKLAS